MKLRYNGQHRSALHAQHRAGTRVRRSPSHDEAIVRLMFPMLVAGAMTESWAQPALVLDYCWANARAAAHGQGRPAAEDVALGNASGHTQDDLLTERTMNTL